MDEGTKTCRCCGEEKPLADFNRDKTTRDGVKTRCRSCDREYNAWLYQRDPEKVKTATRAYAKAAFDADPEKTRAEARVRMSRWKKVNPARAREIQRTHRSANLEERRAACRESYRRRNDREPGWKREYAREWYANNRDKASVTRNRRRAKKIAGTIIAFTADHLEARMSMFPGCWMCGGPKETVDHVKPLEKGGAHMLANLKPACRSCNSSKQHAWPLTPEFLARRRATRQVLVAA